TFRLLEPNALRNVGGHRLNLDADPPTGHSTLVPELRHDRAHGARRDGERNADRAARGGEYRGVDADDVAVHVKGRPAGVAFVHRRVDLDEIVVGTRADVTPARGYNAGRNGTAKAKR